MGDEAKKARELMSEAFPEKDDFLGENESTELGGLDDWRRWCAELNKKYDGNGRLKKEVKE